MTMESYKLNAEMNMVMNERFNVSGAMLVKLTDARAEEKTFEDRAQGFATSDRPGALRPALPGRAHPDGCAGHGLRLRLRWTGAADGTIQVGTVVHSPRTWPGSMRL